MDDLSNILATAGTRLKTNLRASLENLTPEKWIRLVIIVGAYMLLRPFLMKLGEKAQMRAHAADSAEEEQKAAVSPNELRGKVDIPEDSSDEEEEEGGKGSGAADWGKKARRRQRAVIRKMLDEEERRLMESKEEEEDKDIEEFLVG